MALVAAVRRRLTDVAVPFRVVTSGSPDRLDGDPGARMVVLLEAGASGRLPLARVENLIDADEHVVRSTIAEVLTATWITLRSTIEELRASDEPAAIAIVIPASGPVGRPTDGIGGIAAAGVASMVRTLARELEGHDIAVNGVRAPSGTDPERVADAVATFARIDPRRPPTVTGQILDITPPSARTASDLGARDRVPIPSRAAAPDTPGPRRFAGKVALVTGAVRPPHMGRATARRLAAEGADLVLVDSPTTGDPDVDSDATTSGALEELVHEIEALGQRARAVPITISSAEQAEHLVEVIVHEFGRLDACCHLGGGTGPRLGTGPLVEVTDAAWSACLDANLFAPWFVAAAAARQMARQPDGGSIVLLSSYAVLDTPERYGAFCAARAGVVRLAEVLAQQGARDGIRVNTVLPLGVAPGSAPNPGLADLVRQQGGDAAAWAATRIPMGRLQAAEETAAVVAFLASDDASFVSGQAVAVAGGAID